MALLTKEVAVLKAANEVLQGKQLGKKRHRKEAQGSPNDFSSSGSSTDKNKK